MFKELPKKVRFAILWIVLVSLMGFLSNSVTISPGDAVFSLVYLIFALGMIRKEKWAWAGAFIYPILFFLSLVFLDPFFSTLEGLIILFMVLFPILISKKEYDSVAENKFTVYKSIFFWLLIVAIVLTGIYFSRVEEEQKFAHRCHRGKILPTMHGLQALLEISIVEEVEYFEGREAEFRTIVDLFEQCKGNPIIHIKEDKYCASIELWWERDKDLFYCIDHTGFGGEVDTNICSSEILRCH